MISYLQGKVLENADSRMTVLVNGVGYSIYVPSTMSYIGLVEGQEIQAFIHTHVREDALDLYGFLSRLEKEIFLTLLSVTGIGPKGAIGILSKVEPDHLVDLILRGDKESLMEVPGIGKKTAERVVMELADPIRKKVEAGLLGGFAKNAASGARSALARAAAGKASGGAGDSAILIDAKAALLGLGYREGDVHQLLNRVMTEAATPPTRAEELIRAALKQLAQ